MVKGPMEEEEEGWSAKGDETRGWEGKRNIVKK